MSDQYIPWWLPLDHSLRHTPAPEPTVEEVAQTQVDETNSQSDASNRGGVEGADHVGGDETGQVGHE